ncbi:hypothetical protein K490DRAFT_56496 [Saccharata proteae CBS 121410]|uniref:Uncharacterized protein n=1 Tax=Saccharata proteae CBS 121410 TaxID=1314787 RepID=A0A9P4HTU7_9PEZI|nr:hypothetical protein K490DRAFT_56496 [Saccharata proteae CBS 121410]
MMSVLALVTGLLALGVQQVKAAVLQPRADGSSFMLYAYGTDLSTSGLRVFIADGLAYAGSVAPISATDITNITLSTGDTTDGSWLVTPDSDSDVDWAEDTTYWAIGTSSDSLQSVGLANTTGTTTEGMGLYGAWAYHLGDSGDIEMSYRATPTTQDDLYLIQWDPSATSDDDSLLVSLKTNAPVPITDKN